MKILFLDVDGVLNNDTTEERCLGYIGVDKKLAKRLVDWSRYYAKEIDLKIVLSSTWRLHPEMWPALNAEGIEWIDTTPLLMSQDRGDEIKKWLDFHCEVEKYAVLDDNTYNIPEKHKDVFVQTDPSVGLTENDLVKLNTIFLT